MWPQFRAVSFGLYGTQDYHQSVRQRAVEYMRGHTQDYAAFLGENVDDYLNSMEQPGTWGDELTLVSQRQPPPAALLFLGPALTFRPQDHRPGFSQTRDTEQHKLSCCKC